MQGAQAYYRYSTVLPWILVVIAALVYASGQSDLLPCIQLASSLDTALRGVLASGNAAAF